MANDLRKLAQMAKKRLNGASKENESVKTNTYTVYKNLYKYNHKIKIVKNDDSELYQKVCTVLSENFDNPFVLSELVEPAVYDHLTDEEKMRYMLNIIDKYNLLKQKYIKEHIA